MKKNIMHLLFVEQFWAWLIGTTLITFLFELFLFGFISLPIMGYRVPYMGDISSLDIAFAGLFALSFGVGTALFVLVKKFNATTCAIGSGSGILAFFTMLCPVCPVFFLSYFGLSATVMAFAPYFWWVRGVSFALLLLAIIILIRRTKIEMFPKTKLARIFQKLGVVVAGVLFITNQTLAAGIGRQLMGGHTMEGIMLTGDFGKDVAALVTPSEMPFYGPELGLDMSNLNAINASIRKLSVMAPQQGSRPIQLTDAEMKRYVAIGTEPYITCEFCCGVKTLVREDGSPTCGCAHSIAMRGTAAYLIQNYPEMTNEEISYELTRQKGMYFPVQMQQRMASSLAGETADFKPDIKYLVMNLTDKELTDLQNKAKTSGFEPEHNPGMVGGC